MFSFHQVLTYLNPFYDILVLKQELERLKSQQETLFQPTYGVNVSLIS